MFVIIVILGFHALPILAWAKNPQYELQHIFQEMDGQNPQGVVTCGSVGMMYKVRNTTVFCDAITKVNGNVVYSSDHFSKLLYESLDRVELTIVNSDGVKNVVLSKMVVSKYMDGCTYRFRVPRS